MQLSMCKAASGQAEIFLNDETEREDTKLNSRQTASGRIKFDDATLCCKASSWRTTTHHTSHVL